MKINIITKFQTHKILSHHHTRGFFFEHFPRRKYPTKKCVLVPHPSIRYHSTIEMEVFFMKTLIIAAHPNLEESVINRRWLTELRKQPDLCTIHTLAACYPDGRIDVEREHRLIEEHGGRTEETAGISWRGARSRSRSQRAYVRRITASTDDTTIRSRSCSPRLYGEVHYARRADRESPSCTCRR